MAKKKSGVETRTLVVTLLLGALALGSLVAVSVPSWRAQFRAQFTQNTRTVLSVASGNLLNNGTFVKAVKYKAEDGILVEVLSSDQDGARALIDRIKIPGEHDGFFDFYGEASRLAILDVNEDGQMELVAPTFDKELVAHLNIFKYNATSGRFEPLQP